MRLARSVVRDGAAAEDAAQAACARALTALASLRDADRFEAWFFRIVLNEARQRMRATAREVSLDLAAIDRPSGRADDVDALVERIDVRRAIDALEPGLRDAIVLRYDFGMSSAEIGRALSTTAVTARWRLMKAHRRLRVLLASTAAATVFVLAALALAANRSAVLAEMRQLLHAVTIVSGRRTRMTVDDVALARARSDMSFPVIEPASTAGTSSITIEEAYANGRRADGIVTFGMHARDARRDFAIVESRADGPGRAMMLGIGDPEPLRLATSGFTLGRRPMLRGVANGRAFVAPSWTVGRTRVSILSPPGRLTSDDIRIIHDAMLRDAATGSKPRER